MPAVEDGCSRYAHRRRGVREERFHLNIELDNLATLVAAIGLLLVGKLLVSWIRLLQQ